MAYLFERAARVECRRLLLAIALAALSIGPASAGEQGASITGAVPVLSGGVGEGARRQLAEQARGYNLKLVFTFSTGSFLSEVPFQILQGGRAIVSETARGPWAFVKLPPGSYTVQATYEGMTQARKVTVPKAGHRNLPFSWPAPARIKEQPH